MIFYLFVFSLVLSWAHFLVKGASFLVLNFIWYSLFRRLPLAGTFLWSPPDLHELAVLFRFFPARFLVCSLVLWLVSIWDDWKGNVIHDEREASVKWWIDVSWGKSKCIYIRMIPDRKCREVVLFLSENWIYYNIAPRDLLISCLVRTCICIWRVLRNFVYCEIKYHF